MNARFNPGTFVFGLVFLVLGAMFLLEDLDVWDLKASYVVPVLPIGLGVGVAAGSGQPRAR